MTRFDLSKTYYPATATLEEAWGVVNKLEEQLTWANGEWAAELRDDLATWEAVVARLDFWATYAGTDTFNASHEAHDDEQDAAAIEEDRRFEQYRDDEITARHTGEHDA